MSLKPKIDILQNNLDICRIGSQEVEISHRESRINRRLDLIELVQF